MARRGHLYVQDSHVDARGLTIGECFKVERGLSGNCYIKNSHIIAPLYVPRDMIKLQGYSSYIMYGELAEFYWYGKILMMDHKDVDGWKLLSLFLQSGNMLSMPFAKLYKAALGTDK